MSVKSCENLEKSQVKLTIEVGAEEFEKAVNKAYLMDRRTSPASAPARLPARSSRGCTALRSFTRRL